MIDAQPVAEHPFGPDERPQPSWQESSQRLATADTYWLATVRPDGRPHAVPLLAVWVAGTLHFVASQTSRKARNLAHDPHCVITARSGPLDLVAEGTATKVRDEARLRQAAAAYADKYGWTVSIRDHAFYAEGAPTAGPPPFELYQVTPTIAFGFGTDETSNATRWRFAPAA